MKKVLITLALTIAVVSSGLAQGTINWNNSNGSKISVNSVIGGAPTGTTPAYTSATFYYALFYSASATTVGGLSTALMPLANGNNGTYAFQDANWTFNSPGAISGYVTGPAYGTNAAAGRFTPENTDVNAGATITSFHTPAQWVVLGWSATNVTSLAQLATWYNGGNPQTPGYIGESAVSSTLTPGDPTALPPGTPASVFSGAFTLGLVTVPEPSTIALAGLGALSLLLFRRRK